TARSQTAPTVLCLCVLEHHLKPKLKLTRTPASQRGIVIRDVRCRLRRAETARCAKRSVAACTIELRASELGLVEQVEELGSNLTSQFLAELPILDHRAVPGVQAIAA